MSTYFACLQCISVSVCCHRADMRSSKSVLPVIGFVACCCRITSVSLIQEVCSVACSSICSLGPSRPFRLFKIAGRITAQSISLVSCDAIAPTISPLCLECFSLHIINHIANEYGCNRTYLGQRKPRTCRITLLCLIV